MAKKTPISGFRIDPEIWEKFRKKYRNASQVLREWIIKDLEEGEREGKERKVKSGDWITLKENLDSCLQVVGDIGRGKTYTIKELIRNDKEHIYIVFDSHREYDFLPRVEIISPEIKQSSRVEMPKEVSASRGLFPVYVNQILSRKWPDNFVFVIEEAHRYKEEVKLLLSESRKFAKIIAVNQEPLVNYTPIVRIV